MAFLDEVVGLLGHNGTNGLPVLRRCGDDGQLPQTHQRHVQGPGNGRRRQGDHVGRLPQLLEPLLVGDAEALLLVDDDEPQVGELHVFGQQAMGADEDVHPPGRRIGQHLFDLAGRPEARDVLHPHRLVGESIAKGLGVLLGQHGGGTQHCHLPVLGHGQVRRPHGHLGLAEAHVTADEAIRRGGLHEIADDLLDGLELIRRFVEGKRSFELPVPLPGPRERRRLQHLAHGVELHQLVGHVPQSAPDPLLGLLPAGTSEPVQSDLLGGVGAGVALHPGQAVHRQVEPVLAGKLQQEEVLLVELRLCEGAGALLAGDVQGDQPAEGADAVIQVNAEVALTQVGPAADEDSPGIGGGPAPAAHPPTQELFLAEQGDHTRQPEAATQLAADQNDIGIVCGLLRVDAAVAQEAEGRRALAPPAGADAVALQQRSHPLFVLLRRRGEHHRLAGLTPLPDDVHEGRQQVLGAVLAPGPLEDPPDLGVGLHVHPQGFHVVAAERRVVYGEHPGTHHRGLLEPLFQAVQRRDIALRRQAKATSSPELTHSVVDLVDEAGRRAVAPRRLYDEP